jgi:valyl-tRNA synthetase
MSLLECGAVQPVARSSGHESESYIVVVPARESALFEYLERRFKGDPAVSVVLDRRATRRPSPAAASRSVELVQGVTVIRRGEATAVTPQSVHTVCRDAEEGERRMTDGQEMLEDRQRVDRWLEESQYLLGRLIPGYLDDRDRLRVRLVSAEAEADRLRQEIEALRRDLAGLQGELQYQRNEQAAAAEAFAAVLNQLTELQKPLGEVHRRLAAVQTGIVNGVHA